MIRTMKSVTINGETFSRFKTTEQIYHNNGYRYDAQYFRITGDDQEKEKIRKTLFRKSAAILFRSVSLLVFSLYFLLYSATDFKLKR